MHINALEIHERLVKLGTEWAECKYASDLLDDSRRPLLAKLGAESGEKSQNAREAYALSHQDYAEHCKAIAEAAKRTAIAKIKYESALNYVELLRTQAANDRHASKVAT
jgi:hypothetical protein